MYTTIYSTHKYTSYNSDNPIAKLHKPDKRQVLLGFLRQQRKPLHSDTQSKQRPHILTSSSNLASKALGGRLDVTGPLLRRTGLPKGDTGLRWSWRLDERLREGEGRPPTWILLICNITHGVHIYYILNILDVMLSKIFCQDNIHVR